MLEKLFLHVSNRLKWINMSNPTGTTIKIFVRTSVQPYEKRKKERNCRRDISFFEQYGGLLQ